MCGRPFYRPVYRIQRAGEGNAAPFPHNLDDLWMRDTGPVFVHGLGAKAGVDFNFNGWGGKQQHRRDGKIATCVDGRAGVETVHTDLVLEGGGLEVDGEGTALITESCVLNNNRNPGWKKPDVEAELEHLLGIKKVIWLPGIAGHDITDGHTDFYARFAHPGVVVAGLDNNEKSFDYDVTRRHLDILHNATDAQGRPLEIETLEAPSELRYRGAGDDFAAGYINFYVCNGGVIAPSSVTPRPTPRRSPRCSASSRIVMWCRSISTPSPRAAAASTAPPSRNPSTDPCAGHPYSEESCRTVRPRSWKPLFMSSRRTESADCGSRSWPPPRGCPPR